MFDAIKPLLDKGIINEETRTAISEAWESKLSEAKEQIRTELREEMAARYEHDRSVMVTALDKMITENLTSEIEEFQQEKKALVEDRVRIKNHMMENASRFNDFMVSKLSEEIKELMQDKRSMASKLNEEIKKLRQQKKSLNEDRARVKTHMIENADRFNDFMVSKLSEEIKELHADRELTQKNYVRLEKFIVRALSEEITEFQKDRSAVVNTRVKLISEGRTKLQNIQRKFINQSADLVKQSVSENLNKELKQLREDIQQARENMFGRKIFEAFASEFSLTHLNEHKEINKLQKIIQQQNHQIAEAVSVKQSAEKIVESKEREIRVIKETQYRKAILDELLSTLVKEKQTVMRELLESVPSDKLRSAFDKYLPTVLNSGMKLPVISGLLTESTQEFTGDKTANSQVQDRDTNVVELKRLAGLR